ncbi:uncharacterized protein PFL1_03765 [Pseudozyma flocculosa PF-1]|uniref:Beta-glucuronidase C-terminal domain-containing protein n=2 Tax=Pseudozyma flocculosa TaxID=84751 RepID=A0A5C3EWZ0_9BASI|nr:uncharacterized protein PFL1_03765 [Pseudozyma flocculosa PF-1]EPQ28462.1 hypothetical protein PFL1_03765 [Pseudozyma flocculosa PF-1]SPO36380.1 uncharacterized protein PSFLO_01851 [Pseudozyma flocculosa]
MRTTTAATALLAATLAPLALSAPTAEHHAQRQHQQQQQYVKLHKPTGAPSIAHSKDFTSFSFEPAFWTEFFGEAETPNQLTLSLLSRLSERGARPVIRPGGITMDSMIFDPAATKSAVRTTNAKGGVYRTTIGPSFYKAWDNFPEGTGFVSTLNFGNDSYDIARDLAAASHRYQRDKIRHFELGNEPTNYVSTRWQNKTDAYVAQWKDWTGRIDAELDNPKRSWWASSATTDKTGLEVRPAALIPAGIDDQKQVGQYSIHSYAFATCDPKRDALATIPNILNHTHLLEYADVEIYPSAKAALDEGNQWIVGEFNSVACSGKPNVTDTFAQALWTVDTDLIYAERNASAVYLHQGATLVFQSSQQSNTAGDDGGPGFSAYSLLYPVDSSKRGKARVNPGFVGQLFVTEALGTERVASLPAPKGVDSDYFAAYAFYDRDEGKKIRRVAAINSKPYYGKTGGNKRDSSDNAVHLDLSSLMPAALKGKKAWLKRMTAPAVNETDTARVTWAGQSFKQAVPEGKVDIERVPKDGKVEVRDSEAVLVFFYEDDVFRQ